MRNLFLSGLILLMLNGCTVGPNYLRPPVATPADWTISYEAAAGLTDTTWWQQFDDPVLDEMIETALLNNLNLRAAVARVDQFLGQLPGGIAASEER